MLVSTRAKHEFREPCVTCHHPRPALVAAIQFLIALIFIVAGLSLTATAFLAAGLLCLELYDAGVGPNTDAAASPGVSAPPADQSHGGGRVRSLCST